MEQRPIVQGTGSGNNVISVYSDRVELNSGLGGQNTSVGLKQVASVLIRGWVNCTLTIEINDGRRLNVQRMALPDPLDERTTERMT